MFRFSIADGRHVDRIAAGPIVGAGVWIGRLPKGTLRIAVSPTNRTGRFDFAIEGVRVRAWPSVLAAGFRLNPKSARSAILTRLIGWSAESDVNLDWATGSTPVADFERWHAERASAPAFDGMDAPRFDWASAPAIRVVVIGTDAADRAATLRSLDRQLNPNWMSCGSDDIGDAPEGTLTTVVRAGDRLPPTALAYVAEQAHRRRDVRVLYGDVLVDGTDRRVPEFKPGWSPRLAATTGLLDRGVYVRDLECFDAADRRRFLSSGRMPDTALPRIGEDGALPLRRFVLESATEREVAPAPLPTRGSGRGMEATCAIVIPTRDHPFLLSRVVASIRAKSPAGRYRIVVVDNGSVSEEAKGLNADLARHDDVLVLEQPGAFNFSRMCNSGGSRVAGEVLIFLNDDTEVLSEGWLDTLAGHAIGADIGAVGARLTYPDGRLQHIGVLLGMGGSAGHFGALAPNDDPGWADRNLVAHEVSAVTGACLAVERRKLEAVGGFDEIHLPIELSDIDLCLKLAERGWRTMVDPAVHLMHEESVSRGGATLRRLDVYDSERETFVARWAHKLRDDPTFHPGLSLYRWQAALG